MAISIGNRLYPHPTFHVVLHHPCIPPNTGNVARTCAGLFARLHLIEPLGFQLDDRYLKRAGLDYWPHVELEIHESFEKWRARYADTRFWLFSVRGKRLIWDVSFREGDAFVFGCELTGLPRTMLKEYQDVVIKVPQPGRIRSYNLSTVVGMVLYEAYRQVYRNTRKKEL